MKYSKVRNIIRLFTKKEGVSLQDKKINTFLYKLNNKILHFMKISDKRKRIKCFNLVSFFCDDFLEKNNLGIFFFNMKEINSKKMQLKGKKLKFH